MNNTIIILLTGDILILPVRYRSLLRVDILVNWNSQDKPGSCHGDCFAVHYNHSTIFHCTKTNTDSMLIMKPNYSPRIIASSSSSMLTAKSPSESLILPSNNR